MERINAAEDQSEAEGAATAETANAEPARAARGRGSNRRSGGAATRERVLAVALTLFNRHGPERVTTAEIAAASGINEGNLYYWFPRKAQIAEALFGALEEAMIAVAEREIADPADPHCYAEYQLGWFALMSEFRFFYRDGVALRAIAPKLRGRMQVMTLRTQAAVRRVLLLMREHGLLAASDQDIDTLIGNLWIVSGYWMDFYTLHQDEAQAAAAPPSADGQPVEADLAWGIRQVSALVRPYLTARGAIGPWAAPAPPAPDAGD